MTQEEKNNIKELESIHKKIQESLVNLWVKIQEMKKVCHKPDLDDHYCKDASACRYGTPTNEDDYEEMCECCLGNCKDEPYCNCWDTIPKGK